MDMKNFNSDKGENKEQFATSTVDSTNHISSAKRDNAIFYFGILSLLGIIGLLFFSQPVINIKLAAATGIIFCISIMRLFEIKQKK